MAIKRIVPSAETEPDSEYVFADGAQSLPEWESQYADDALVQDVTFETMGEAKTLKEITYQEWLDKVFSVMQIRSRFLGEVLRQRKAHFTRVS